MDKISVIIGVLIGLPMVGFIMFKLIYKPKTYKAREKRTTEKITDKKAQSGVFFGIDNRGRKAYKTEEQEGHILIVGGSGSGKSTSVIIPSLRDYRNNIVAIDVKGELSKTVEEYGFRDGKKQLIINPKNVNSAKYNPLWEISGKSFQEKIKILNRIAYFIFTESEGSDPFWTQAARMLFLGLMAYYAGYKNYEFTESIENILINLNQENIKSIVEEIQKELEIRPELLDIIKFLGQFCDMNASTYTSITGNLAVKLHNLDNSRELKNNVFTGNGEVVDFEELLKNETDIYLQIEEQDLSIYGDFVALFLGQLLDFFQERQEYNQEILILIDELPRLGKIEGLQNSLSTLRSKRISIVCVIQSLAQLNKLYGKETAKIIIDNCQYLAILSATEKESAEYFACLVGKYDAKTETTTIGKNNKKSVTRSLTEKFEFPPETLRVLPSKNRLILLNPEGQFLLNKQPFFKVNKKR